MKKVLCLCLAVLLALCAVGCSNNNTTNNTVQTASDNHRGENPSLDTSNKEVAENPQLTANGLPPLAENLQLMFRGAEEMVRAFTLCSFQKDSTKTLVHEGMTYNPIVDPRFTTYTKLQEYLNQYFTKEYIDSQLLTPNSCVQKFEDDVAGVIDASGIEDSTYAGHVFRVDSKDDTKIAFTATVYFAADVYMENYFFTTPANPGEFTTKEYTFQLDYTQNGWRFSKFSFLRG